MWRPPQPIFLKELVKPRRSAHALAVARWVLSDLRIGEAWVLDEHEAHRIDHMPCEIAAYDDRAGAGGGKRIEVAHVREHADVVGPGRVERRDVLNEDLVVARFQRFRADDCGDRAEGKRPRTLEEDRSRRRSRRQRPPRR